MITSFRIKVLLMFLKCADYDMVVKLIMNLDDSVYCLVTQFNGN